MAEITHSWVEVQRSYECDKNPHSGTFVIFTGQTFQQGNSTKYVHECPIDGQVYNLDREYPVNEEVYVDITKVQNFLQ